MKNKFLFLYASLLLLGFCQFSFSQTDEMSDSAKHLAAKVKVGDNQSILDAGKSGDKSVVPYLKTLASKGSPWAQMSLAKLGEEEYFDEILAEADAPEVGVQNRAFRKLAYVGGKKAFRKLFELLNDTEPRDERECAGQVRKFQEIHPESAKCDFCCDVMIFSRASEVAIVLSHTIKNPPVKSRYGSDKDIKLWKQWFEEHKDLME